ncbi:hypothetical protein [Halostagnicola bangensis]
MTAEPIPSSWGSERRKDAVSTSSDDDLTGRMDNAYARATHGSE